MPGPQGRPRYRSGDVSERGPAEAEAEPEAEPGADPEVEPAAAADPAGVTARTIAVWAFVGAALLLGSYLLLGRPRHDVPGAEQTVFEGVNDLPDVFEWLAWPVMELGTLWMAPVGALAAFAATRRWPAAAATAWAVVLAWLAAHWIKDAVGRGRPADLLADATVRQPGVDDEGYVSGHTTVAFALATALTPLVPPRWRWVPATLALCVGIARIYVGVHLPLDVAGGAGVGILAAVAALLTFGIVPGRRAN
jgi:glycosyltransferase 2 family protein